VTLFVAKTCRLTTLHTILSTGSPLKPQLFDYVYTNVKSNVILGSVTGGTDIIACFAGNNTSLPVYRGEIQSLHLGCAIESWSEEGMIHTLARTRLVAVLLVKLVGPLGISNREFFLEKSNFFYSFLLEFDSSVS